MKLKLICAGTVLALAACAASDRYSEVIAQSQPPSAALRAQLAQGAEKLVYDPASIRKAEISNVASFPDGLQGVCVRADSKNVEGNYMGVRNIGLPMRDGKIIGGTLDHPICNRADVPWNKFPELDALGRGKK